jgi:hypothetical protein
MEKINMEKKAKSNLKLGVLIAPPKAEYHGSDIQAYRISIVTINERNEVRNPSDSAWGEDAFTAPYASLMFRAQGNVLKAEERETYGWSLEYREVYSVDLNDAERMVKMLRKIANVKLPVQPRTYGQFVQMMCRALGITVAVQLSGKATGWHTEADYAFFGASDIEWMVDRMVTYFLESQRPKREESAA